MNHELLGCGGCEVAPCAPCVEENFEATEAYSLLIENDPRYANWMWEDKQKMMEWFGDDLDPVRHGRHQAEHVAIPLIEYNDRFPYQAFTEEQARTLVLTNVVHDYHEGITGDIPHPDKTRESDLHELALNHEIVKEITNDEIAAQVKEVMGDFDGNTFVGRAFKAGELVGYLKTGLHAWHLRRHEGLTAEERGKCYAMGFSVTRKAAQELQKYREEFPYVDHVLNFNHKYIEEIG